MSGRAVKNIVRNPQTSVMQVRGSFFIDYIYYSMICRFASPGAAPFVTNEGVWCLKDDLLYFASLQVTSLWVVACGAVTKKRRGRIEWDCPLSPSPRRLGKIQRNKYHFWIAAQLTKLPNISLVIWISLLMTRQPICRVVSGILLGKEGTLLLFSSGGSNIVIDGCPPSISSSNALCKENENSLR